MVTAVNPPEPEFNCPIGMSMMRNPTRIKIEQNSRNDPDYCQDVFERAQIVNHIGTNYSLPEIDLCPVCKRKIVGFRPLKAGELPDRHGVDLVTRIQKCVREAGVVNLEYCDKDAHLIFSNGHRNAINEIFAQKEIVTIQDIKEIDELPFEEDPISSTNQTERSAPKNYLRICTLVAVIGTAIWCAIRFFVGLFRLFAGQKV